jgi:hypothetical protein
MAIRLKCISPSLYLKHNIHRSSIRNHVEINANIYEVLNILSMQYCVRSLINQSLQPLVLLTLFSNNNFRFFLGFRYRASSIDHKIKVPNRCNQLYVFIVYVTSHPTCFGPLLAHHKGCPGLLVYATIWFMQCCCLSVRPRTHEQTTALHEQNGGINKQPRAPLMMGQ